MLCGGKLALKSAGNDDTCCFGSGALDSGPGGRPRPLAQDFVKNVCSGFKAENSSGK